MYVAFGLFFAYNDRLSSGAKAGLRAGDDLRDETDLYDTVSSSGSRCCTSLSFLTNDAGMQESIGLSIADPQTFK